MRVRENSGNEKPFGKYSHKRDNVPLTSTFASSSRNTADFMNNDLPEGRVLLVHFLRRRYILFVLILGALFSLNLNHLNNAIDNVVRMESLPQAPLETTPPHPAFFDVAEKTGTDKVLGYKNLQSCLNETKGCSFPQDQRETCRPWGHFYDTIYDRWLAPYSKKDAGPFQFLEIGFFTGWGFEAYTKFLAPNEKAELHSMEVACSESPPIEWINEASQHGMVNEAAKHPWYQRLVDTSRLHCGDASNYEFLHNTWIHKMKRNGEGPPLKVVVDDGSHKAPHMAASLFFWFPRIEPGGILVVEDIQPIQIANQFRTHIVPQVMKDLHWCGGPQLKDSRCFPTIQPFLEGVHCEMHICVFVRNDKAAIEPSRADSLTPENAFSGAQKCLFGPHNGQ